MRLRHPPQVSCGPVEDISIRETLTKTSLQLVGLLHNAGLRHTDEVTSSPQNPLADILSSLFLTNALCLLPSSLCVVQKSVSHLEKIKKKTAKGSSSTNSVIINAKHSPCCLSERLKEEKKERNRQRESVSLFRLLSAHC